MADERYDLHIRIPKIRVSRHRVFQLLPSPSNVIFTFLVIGAILWAQNAGAVPFTASTIAATNTIAYQGRLANTGGQPLTGAYPMVFRLYNAASGGTPLWEEQWTASNSVQVSDGLFNVMLGSLTPIPAAVTATNSSLFLGISVGSDSEMAPRVQLGSVPFAVQALTVPDESITAAKIANGAITQAKAPTLIKGMLNNASIQWGSLTPSASSTTDTIVVDIDFNPNFTSRPMLILQPSFHYTPRVIAAWGSPCDGNACRVWITRTDGGSWQAGENQGLDWIAAGN